MRVYKTDGQCPKCGNRRENATYYKAHGEGIEREYLMRVCSRCEYRWPEACLDSPEAAQADNSITEEPRLTGLSEAAIKHAITQR